MDTITKPAFRSYRAMMESGPVLVINSGKNKSGEPLLKVRSMTYAGYTAEWDREPVTQYRYGPGRWVKASAVTK